MSTIHTTPLRIAAASTAFMLAGALLSMAPASADDSGPAHQLAEHATGDAHPKRSSQGGSALRGKAGTFPSSASSATDFAQGAVSRSARVADPMGGANDGTVVHTDAVQDLAGQRLKATITLKPGVASRLVAVYFGRFSGTSCHSGAAIFGATTSTTSGGLFLPGSTTFPVTRSRSGSVLTLTSQARSAFRTANYDCAFVHVFDPADSSGDALQSFYAEQLNTRWIPAFTIAGGEPIKAARKGKWVNLRLEVRNTSRAAASNVKVRASGAGLTIKPRVRNLGSISDRTTRYGVRFKVRVAKGTKSRKLTLKVTGNGARTATRRFTIGVAPKPKKYKSLAGRYFWGFAPTSATATKGWDTQVMWFLNKRWVHIGAPKNGKVPRCRTTTKRCKKYSYNSKSGVAKVGGKKFKVNTEGFTHRAKKDKKRFYEPVTFPRKNQRFATHLVNNDWRGNCLISCTATVSNLTLNRNGRFVRGSFSVGSWPGIGSSWSLIPADQRGTYRIIGKGRIQLKYASGKVERTRIGLMHNALNRPSATSGIVLGTKNYYFDD